MGVLYAEGARRYIETLSTYLRRRISHAARASVDSVRHAPAAAPLRTRRAQHLRHLDQTAQRTAAYVLASWFARVSKRAPPGPDDQCAYWIVWCSIRPGAESMAFNAEGACPTCVGTGGVRDIDDTALISAPSKSLEEEAVAPWRMSSLSVMPKVAAALGGHRCSLPRPHGSRADYCARRPSAEKPDPRAVEVG